MQYPNFICSNEAREENWPRNLKAAEARFTAGPIRRPLKNWECNAVSNITFLNNCAVVAVA